MQALLEKSYQRTWQCVRKRCRAKVISKIASFTTLQYVNHLSVSPIGHVKYALYQFRQRIVFQ